MIVLGTAVPCHRLDITVDPDDLDEDDDGGRANDGRSTGCIYTVYPKIYDPPAWENRDDGTVHTAECLENEVCKIRMQNGQPKPLVRHCQHEGRQVITSICKLETTTTTITATTTLGPDDLYTPKPGSKLAAAKSSGVSTIDWLGDPLRTIAELRDVEEELEMQWSQCQIEFQNTPEDCNNKRTVCWPSKCSEVKELFEESESAVSSQASKEAQDAKSTTTIAAAAGGSIVLLVLVIGIYCAKKGGSGGGPGAGQLNGSGGIIAFSNPNYDFDGAAAGKHNPAYSEQYAQQGGQEGGEGLYDDAAFAIGQAESGYMDVEGAN